MIKYIVFDLDGVLFDGCELHSKLFIESVLEILPNSNLDKKYHDSVLNALSTRQKLKVMNIENEYAEKIYNLKQEKTNQYVNNIQPNIKNIKICEKLISLNYKLYCVSNSIRNTIETVLRGMGIIHMFSGIISNQDTTKPKPSPEPYLTLYRNYNLDPQECLIIEDSPYGIESATKSGGNVMRVRDCEDVTIENILDKSRDF